MVGGFYHIVHVDDCVGSPNSIRLKDMARLLMSEATTLDMVRVVGEVNLCAVIDASFEVHLLLLARYGKERHHARSTALGQ